MSESGKPSTESIADDQADPEPGALRARQVREADQDQHPARDHQLHPRHGEPPHHRQLRRQLLLGDGAQPHPTRRVGGQPQAQEVRSVRYV